MNNYRPVKFWKKKKGEYTYYDFTGYYEVNEDGIIRSVDRYVNNSVGTVSFKKGKECKYKKNNGYYVVSLSMLGITNEWFSVHNIVAQAFPEICGEWFEDCHTDHINTVRTDCRAINLRICTEKENHNNPITVQHLKNSRKGYIPWNKGKSGYSINRTVPDNWGHWKKVKVMSIKDGEKIIYDSIREAARATGALPPNIIKCCVGEYKTSMGYKWQYV